MPEFLIVQLVRLAAAVVAVLLAVAQVIEERHRLSVVRSLPGPRARAYHETSRHRSEKVMLVMTVVFLLLGLGAALDLSGLFSPEAPR